MTRIRIKSVTWSEWTINHIQKHAVTVAEAEEAIAGFLAHKHGYKGRYIIIGRSGTRILSVIVKREKEGVYRLITVRDADKKERKLIYDKEDKKNTDI